ncbi:MAG: hypothetical protein J5759_01785 [Bacteroidales bacterium]|nr:hypothetical protein [Bacteroidales bacterium]
MLKQNRFPFFGRWHFLFLLLFCFLLSCEEQHCIFNDDKQSHSSIWPILYGGTGVNSFVMWITLNEDKSAIVQSGCPQYDHSFTLIEDTDDLENVYWSVTQDGFILKNSSGDILYTAVAREGEVWDEHSSLPFNAIVYWSHSPGSCWDKYAKEKGWERNVEVHMQVID